MAARRIYENPWAGRSSQSSTPAHSPLARDGRAAADRRRRENRGSRPSKAKGGSPWRRGGATEASLCFSRRFVCWRELSPWSPASSPSPASEDHRGVQARGRPRSGEAAEPPSESEGSLPRAEHLGSLARARGIRSLCSALRGAPPRRPPQAAAARPTPVAVARLGAPVSSRRRCSKHGDAQRRCAQQSDGASD